MNTDANDLRALGRRVPARSFMDLQTSQSIKPKRAWEGDWRLAIAEERVALAEQRLALVEERMARVKGK